MSKQTIALDVFFYQDNSAQTLHSQKTFSHFGYISIKITQLKSKVTILDVFEWSKTVSRRCPFQLHIPRSRSLITVQHIGILILYSVSDTFCCLQWGWGDGMPPLFIFTSFHLPSPPAKPLRRTVGSLYKGDLSFLHICLWLMN